MLNNFPKEFLIGGSTAENQIEGAYNEGGKGVFPLQILQLIKIRILMVK